MATIHISLFGDLEVRRASGEPIVLESKKARALLAFLAHQPGRLKSREQVCGLLWGDRDEPQAQGSLRQTA